jgi:lipid-binding SYLF domain-containing protein
MNKKRLLVKAGVAVIAFGLLGGCVTTPKGETPSEKRHEVQKMRADTLAELYKIHPPAKARIKHSKGYAVFSNVGVNLLLVSAAGGWGVAHDNKTGQDIYMKMVSGGVGLGLGVKDFRGVFVFNTKEAFKDFTERGWEAGAQADAAAKSGNKGGAAAGAVTVAPGVDLYQITEQGLALQATIQGTKYYRDDDLNAPVKTKK